MVDEPESELLVQQLVALGSAPEDVRAAVKRPAVTASGQRDTLVRQGTGGVMAKAVNPLPNEDTVLKLDERLASVELRLKETNEKLDRVLAALEKE